MRHKLHNGYIICSKKCDEKHWRIVCQELREIGIDPHAPKRSVDTQNYNAVSNWISQKDFKHVPDRVREHRWYPEQSATQWENDYLDAHISEYGNLGLNPSSIVMTGKDLLPFNTNGQLSDEGHVARAIRQHTIVTHDPTTAFIIASLPTPRDERFLGEHSSIFEKFTDEMVKGLREDFGYYRHPIAQESRKKQGNRQPWLFFHSREIKILLGGTPADLNAILNNIPGLTSPYSGRRRYSFRGRRGRFWI